MSLSKSLKKMGLDKKSVVRSSENILLYPRIYIYDRNQLDSVAYFGCISNDKKSFISYFENNAKGVIKLKIGGSPLVREAGEYADSIKTLPLNTLIDRLSTRDSTSTPIVDSKARFLVVYYWNPDIIDRDIIKNYKYLKKYSANHPELKIQVLAVLNE